MIASNINTLKRKFLKNIFLYIIILILISILIYQNSTKEELSKNVTQNLSSQNIEKCKEQEDKEIVEKVIDNHINENQLTDQEALLKTKKSLKLSRVDNNEVLIEWSIDTKNIDNDIRLVATLSKNDLEDKKVFKFKIAKTPTQSMINETVKNLTADFIKVENESLEEVRSNLSLPQMGMDGSKITWKSDNPNIVSNRGVVIRPSFNQEEVIVTLTATVNQDGREENKEFSITVMPDESEIREVKE